MNIDGLFLTYNWACKANVNWDIIVLLAQTKSILKRMWPNERSALTYTSCTFGYVYIKTELNSI